MSLKKVILVFLFLMPLGMIAQIFHRNNHIEVFHNNTRHVFDEKGNYKSSISLSFLDNLNQGPLSHYFNINNRVYAFLIRGEACV